MNTKQTTFVIISLSVLILLLGTAFPALAQDNSVSLRMSKTWGFSSGTGDIQGTFTLHATAPPEVQRVAFFVDGQLMGEDTNAPFELRFNTESYSPGVHDFTATGYTADGRELTSNLIQGRVLTADQARGSTMRIVIPILVLVIGATLLSAVIPMLSNRGKKPPAPGTPRKYGTAGGAICVRCGRPFSRNFLAPNLLVGKLERCPYCGKWAIVPAASPAELRAAEQAELEAAGETAQVNGMSEEEKLQKELEESRYNDV